MLCYVKTLLRKNMAVTKRDFFLIPNIISLLRCLCALPAYLLFQENPARFAPILILCTIIILTDFLDGALARKLNQHSDLGLLLDPLGDKLVIIAAFLAMIQAGHIAAPLFIIIVGKDLSIAAAGTILIRKSGSIPASNTHGKWASACLAFGIAFRVVFLKSTITPALSQAAYSAFSLLAIAGISLGVTFALLSLVSYGCTAYSLVSGKTAEQKTKLLLYLLLATGALLFFILTQLPALQRIRG